MILHAFGCSLTYGHGLSDCIGNDIKQPGPNPSKQSWPSVLSNITGVEYKNHALPGISNKFILKKILDTKIQSNDFVVVQWTFYSRWTIFDREKEDNIGPWTESFDNFLKNFYSDYDCEWNNRLMIDHAWLHLKNVGCKFVFSCAEYKNEKWWCEEDKVPHLFDQRKFLYTDTFYSSIKEFFVDKSLDNRHPGPKSHIEFAKYLANLPVFSELTNTKTVL